jgi:hypothetical protein
MVNEPLPARLQALDKVAGADTAVDAFLDLDGSFVAAAPPVPDGALGERFKAFPVKPAAPHVEYPARSASNAPLRAAGSRRPRPKTT